MIEKVKGRDHLVEKKDGRLQKYSPSKMKKALLRICQGNEDLAKQLYEALDLKIYNKIKVGKLWDEVIETAANMISDMYPIWDEVAKRAYLEKLYSESYNLKSEIEDLDFMDVLQKGMSVGVYSRDVVTSFTDEEITELGNYIKRERDLDFSYIGLVFFSEKSSFNYSLTKKLELPQHTYMRMAMYAFWKEEDSVERMQLIKDRYDDLSTFIYTEATPKVNNSMTNNPQMASCVLNTVDDDAKSILHTKKNLGLFSKYGGGLALDVSKLRCSGSFVGKQGGKSSGPVQFIRGWENVVGEFDQMGKRKGACVITFPFWHMDVKDLIMLKDAGGSENKRARGLMYTIKWYKIFSDRIKANEDITLFDPKETPELNETWGEEFEKWYLHYENKGGIRKKRVPAREIAFLFAKVRSETGNLYVVFPDNVNDQRMGELPVFASNLCTEIFLPTRASSNFEDSMTFDISGNGQIHTTMDAGEIALCNLSSINVVAWKSLSHERKVRVIDNLLRASDNLIEYQYYPVQEGRLSNLRRRPIGIGMSNYTNGLAIDKLGFTSEGARQWTHEIAEDISYHVLAGSVRLAKERGAYEYFRDSKWAEGIVPMDLYKMKDVDGYNFPLHHDWDALREDIKTYGVRFSYHFAIAPTATSSIAIGATEGTEPTKKLFEMKEGTFTLPRLAPNLKHNRMYYVNAFEVPNTTINDLASIRQKFWDQGQSVSHYYQTTDSAYEIIVDVMHAEKVGLKSLYYLQPMKAGDIESCVNCSS